MKLLLLILKGIKYKVVQLVILRKSLLFYCLPQVLVVVLFLGGFCLFIKAQHLVLQLQLILQECVEQFVCVCIHLHVYVSSVAETCRHHWHLAQLNFYFFLGWQIGRLNTRIPQVLEFHNCKHSFKFVLMFVDDVMCLASIL